MAMSGSLAMDWCLMSPMQLTITSGWMEARARMTLSKLSASTMGRMRFRASSSNTSRSAPTARTVPKTSRSFFFESSEKRVWPNMPLAPRMSMRCLLTVRAP